MIETCSPDHPETPPTTCTLDEWCEANADAPDEVEAVRALNVDEDVMLGGGAGVLFRVRRVA